MQIEQLHMDMEEKDLFWSLALKELKDLLFNQTAQSDIKVKKLDEKSLEKIKLSQLKKIVIKDDKIMKKIEMLNEAFDKSLDLLNKTVKS